MDYDFEYGICHIWEITMYKWESSYAYVVIRQHNLIAQRSADLSQYMLEYS